MYLYILKNELNNLLYIGVTSDLERRIFEHNNNNNHFTGKGKGDWKLIFYRIYSNNSSAYKEERRLKKAKNKQYLKWYINKYNDCARSSMDRATPF